MISRRTTKALSKVLLDAFTHLSGSSYFLSKESFYDFLFLHDFEPWFCNVASKPHGYNEFRGFILKLHTGESIAESTKDWSWEKRRSLGQKLIKRLAECYLSRPQSEFHPYSLSDYYEKKYRGARDELLRSLELDGYTFRENKLFYSERDVLDHEEEKGILEALYGSLRLGRRDEADHFLDLSEKHFLESRWGDSVANSRKFLECVLMEAAFAHARAVPGTDPPAKAAERPAEVRDYLEEQGLIDAKERDAISKVYGLLSHTGAHPYMAEKDQARLLRQLSLTLAQFVMLRLQGKLSP